MSRRTGVETRLEKAVIIACGLLLAVAAMIALGVAEGTPAPQNAPSVAPRPSKW